MQALEDDTESGDFVTLQERREPWRDKILPWLVVILLVLTVGSIIRSYIIQDAVTEVQTAADDVGTTAEEARDAAIEARDELRTAITAIEATREPGEPDLQNQAIIDALAAVGRIEIYLCGGPCPE